jgi:ATP-dependent DNA helicase RecG
MQLRGPGNIEGTQQSGVLDLKVADLTTDQEILQQARNCVIEIFDKDPQLALPENQILNQAFQTKNAGLSWDKIS